MRLLFILLSMFWVLNACQSTTAQAPDKPVPSDTALLELTLPAGASFKINNEQYRPNKPGEARILPFRPFKPDQIGQYELKVEFSSGAVAKRTLSLCGGDRVRLPFLAPGTSPPELIPQMGHHETVTSVSFCPDSRRRPHWFVRWDCHPVGRRDRTKYQEIRIG